MVQVDYLKSRMKDLEDKYPWITTGRPSEIPFWVMPAGQHIYNQLFFVFKVNNSLEHDFLGHYRPCPMPGADTV
jgi:hypothetical protein